MPNNSFPTISTGRVQHTSTSVPIAGATSAKTTEKPAQTMTEVMDNASLSWYNGSMHNWGAWLHDLSTKPLPGGVSAAALASAMGAALVAKTLRISLHKQEMKAEDHAAVQAALDLASYQQQTLVSLAQADEDAFRAVLDSRARRDGTQSEAKALRRAIETPVCLAEACHLLLRQLPDLRPLCWPAVEPDLDIGQWLLEVGLRTGLLAAESNAQAWTDAPELASLQARIDALRPARQDCPDS
jgi:formiminotetrahydrofolate cyclodeaminase